jgi:hypothetical protein
LTKDCVCSANGRIVNNLLNGRYVQLAMARHIHKRETHPLVREDVT